MRNKISLLLLFLIFPFLAQAQSENLKVMTFNIRYNNPDDGVNAWPARKDRVIQYLQTEKPDVICVQEALEGQMEDLANGLAGYAWIGRGRDKSKKKGEFAGIFYKTERVQLREEGNFWLSDTPDKPGSIGWDAELPRIVTWGFFRDQGTGKSFYLFNTHFSHKGSKARLQSTKMICSKAKKISSRFPSLICGDLNMQPDDPTMENFKLSGYTDTRTTTETDPAGPEGTCYGFSTEAQSGIRIDYILTRNDVTVKTYSVSTQSENGYYLSDHLPVISEVVIGN